MFSPSEVLPGEHAVDADDLAYAFYRRALRTNPIRTNRGRYRPANGPTVPQPTATVEHVDPKEKDGEPAR